MATEYASQIEALEERLGEVTEAALAEMEATADLAARQPHLRAWEAAIDKEIRPTYKALSDAIRVAYKVPEHRREQLSKRVNALTKAIVVNRACLEGLAEGGPPKPHQAGGAYWPPSNCGPELVAQCREILEVAKELFLEEAAVLPHGELQATWLKRCRVVLEEALEEVRALLEASGTEFRAFFDELYVEMRHLQWSAYKARGPLPQDRQAEEIRRKLAQTIREKLREAPQKGELKPHEVEKWRSETLLWARAQEAAALRKLRELGIQAELQPVIEESLQDIQRTAGELSGRWDNPPVFESIRFAQLPPGVRTGAHDGDGVYVQFNAEGHLKEAVLIKDGRPEGRLWVSDREPRARYEDSANVAEFRPDGVIDAYGGRYEHETRAQMSFRDWVRSQIRQMLQAQERKAVVLRRPGRRS